MLPRILGLIGLGVLAVGALAASSFFSKVMYNTAGTPQADRATYFAHTWLITFGILSGVWIWLLLKTIYYRREDDDSSNQ